MKSKKIISLVLALSIICSVSLYAQAKTSSVEEGAIESQITKSNLNFDVNSGYSMETIKVNNRDVTYRAYNNIVYVSNPVDTKYQCMNIYIPEGYFNGETINGFNSKTAPVFFPNMVGGYMPSAPGVPEFTGKVGEEKSPNAALTALSKGYVVACPGARGRVTQNEEGIYTGKAPSVIVDLKAALRYLHYNDSKMPGTAEKIISNGTSAGGAVSSLVGAAGNNSDYEPYLKELGAAKASDAVYAVSAYCPITNLDNADKAYEWLLNGVNDYTKMEISFVDGEIHREIINKTMTDYEIELADELKEDFPSYLNKLKLRDENGKKLTLNKNGDGSFKEYVKSFIIKSAQTALDNGDALSDKKWITIENGKVADIDFKEYAASELGRSKAAPAFDSIDLSSPENNLFGTSTINALHFTKFSASKDKDNGEKADSKTIKMMNPMNYIGTKGSETAKYWRIRHGEKDSDTSVAIPAILALKLKNKGCKVDFAVPWDTHHGGDYDLDELFNWIDSVVR